MPPRSGACPPYLHRAEFSLISFHECRAARPSYPPPRPQTFLQLPPSPINIRSSSNINTNLRRSLPPQVAVWTCRIDAACGCDTRPRRASWARFRLVPKRRVKSPHHIFTRPHRPLLTSRRRQRQQWAVSNRHRQTTNRKSPARLSSRLP